MNRSLKKFYPRDYTYCMYGDDCKKKCKRKISDYELRLIDFQASFADLRNSEYCSEVEE